MKVFVSFDFEHDRVYKYLLEAWSINSSINFVSIQFSPMGSES